MNLSAHLREVGASPSITRRFWSKVQRGAEGECWLWTGGKDSHGYGMLGLGGRDSKHERAHRISFIFANGQIPVGAHILHHCDTPPCVNPAHLYAGTQQDNVNDAIQRGRMRHAKLTAPAVHLIRAALANGESQRALGRRFGVSAHTILMIRRRRVWKHV